jgi:hypothetical protein
VAQPIADRAEMRYVVCSNRDESLGVRYLEGGHTQYAERCAADGTLHLRMRPPSTAGTSDTAPAGNQGVVASWSVSRLLPVRRVLSAPGNSARLQQRR